MGYVINLENQNNVGLIDKVRESEIVPNLGGAKGAHVGLAGVLDSRFRVKRSDQLQVRSGL